MYEFFVALKYLIPKKKSLNATIISLISIFVITLVIWLILVFLSVTRGIEKNWLNKLTTLNAHLRIIPTKKYYNSYYYQIDKISKNSNFTLKTIREKYRSATSDPYNNKIDREIPQILPKKESYEDGSIIDPVKKSYEILKSKKDIYFQDYEISAAPLKISLLRQFKNFVDKESFISQMSYILSLPENNPYLSSIILKPKIDDLNNLLFYLKKEESSQDFFRFFKNIKIKKINICSIDKKTFPENSYFTAFAKFKKNKPIKIFIENSSLKTSKLIKGIIFFKNGNFIFKNEKNKYFLENCKVYIKNPYILNISEKFLPKLLITTKIQNKELKGKVDLTDLKILEANIKFSFDKPPKYEPLWIYKINNKIIMPKNIFYYPIILPKMFKKNGVLLGDKGCFSYTERAPFSIKENKIKVFVSGFYDPGVLPIGNRSVIASKNITSTLLSSSFIPEDISSNGIFIWAKNITSVDQIKKDLEKHFKKEKIDKFWRIETYNEYPFSKDLMQQFQSDRLLFTLIAIIILIVAFCNIISFLIILVNDKKKEIATLQAMGATKKSIALIFGFCGIVVSSISSVFGILTALFTLRHLDSLIKFLSFLQGHSMFNKAFFGEKLPNTFSIEALFFILISIPIISIISAIVPAIKACKINPSKILR
ncbi:MAG: hypothetical protein AMS24_01355 [Chlamydiae bacterium SM23_39]|nr:MAG: hypothetical protein AMS24_01355 [Chlamydiae bacterium SM23_39]